MTIYPAIDLLGGACVRLRQGDYGRVTRHSRDPVAMARAFVEEGAEALHVVDLDGARAGHATSEGLVLALARAVPVPVQAGGGLRSDRDVARYLDGGVTRVVLGTGAASDPQWLAGVVARHGPQRVAAAVDVRGGRPLVDGWLAEAPLDLPALLAALREAGVRTVVYTDAARDGTLGSPDLGGAGGIVEWGFETIVAGGVASAADIRRAAAIGAAGVVVGSALYEGALTLPEALAAAAEAHARRPGGRSAWAPLRDGRSRC